MWQLPISQFQILRCIIMSLSCGNLSLSQNPLPETFLIAHPFDSLFSTVNEVRVRHFGPCLAAGQL